jgi:hypothetical protein
LVAKFAQDAAKNRQVAGLRQQATLDAVPEDGDHRASTRSAAEQAK